MNVLFGFSVTKGAQAKAKAVGEASAASCWRGWERDTDEKCRNIGGGEGRRIQTKEGRKEKKESQLEEERKTQVTQIPHMNTCTSRLTLGKR